VSTTDHESVVPIDPNQIARAQNGDADALAALFEAHKDRIYSLCLRMTNNTEEAEALTQDVFIHVFRKLSTFRGDSSFSSWLYPIAVKTLVEQLQKKCNGDVAFDQPGKGSAYWDALKSSRQSRIEECQVSVAAILTLGLGAEAGTGFLPATKSALGDTPVAMLDVLGEPVLHRIIQGLRDSKVSPIFLLINHALAKSALIRNLDRTQVDVIVAPENDLAAATQAALANCKERGLRAALVMRAATYLEFNVEDMFGFHCAARQPITFLADSVGRFETAMIDCAASDSATAFLAEGDALESNARDYVMGSYANRLQTPADLRQLAQDAFSQRCKIRPSGVEVRPGVWIAESARLHPLARVEGPAYVGAHTRLRAGVHVTRSTSIERNCEVDRGCTVDNATILPGTYLGVGLEIAYAVAHRNRLIDLKRAIDIEIEDSGFLGSASVPNRVWMDSLVRLISFRLNPSTWRPLIDRLENAFSGGKPIPVPAPGKLSYGGTKPWTVFDELPTAINSERI
jgi:RNA polymerase sigma factor (sigma-70 family)